MTRKLEELLELPADVVEDGLPDYKIPDEVTPDNVPEAKPENNPVMQNTLSELDKVQAALPLVRGLEASDTEMDDLAGKAVKGYEDMMD